MNIDYRPDGIHIHDKVITKLDRFVLDFVDLLQKRADYVVVSGFVAILFGRSRGTEDIDMIVERMSREEFHSFHQMAQRNGYHFLNPEKEEGLYEMLEEGLEIRAALEKTVIPNIELKFVKDDFDRYSLENRIRVWISGRSINISPVEMQNPFELWLGSEKDVEDAIFLWEIFKERIDRNLLTRFTVELNVRGESYGIEV